MGRSSDSGSSSQWALESRRTGVWRRRTEARTWPRCFAVRGSPLVVERPSAGLRLVERVRAGLRRAVADRRPEPRGLVPALVLGDTSGLEEDLTRDFQTHRLDASDRRVRRKPHAAAGVSVDRCALGGRQRLVAARRWPSWSGRFRRLVPHRAKRAARGCDGSGGPGGARIRSQVGWGAQPRGRHA